MHSQFLAVSLFATAILSTPVPKFRVNGRLFGKAVGTAFGAAGGVAAGIPLGPVGIAGASALGSQGGAVAGEKAGAAIEKAIAIHGKNKNEGDKKNKPPPVPGKPITMPVADKSDLRETPSNYPSGPTATINAGSTHSSTSVQCVYTSAAN